MFTPREKDIIKAVCQGLSNKDVAAEFGITIKTVKWYLTNIYSKLGLKSRSELIVYYFKTDMHL